MITTEKAIIEQAKDFVRDHFDKYIDKKYTYHNYGHTLKVYDAVLVILRELNMPEEDAEALKLAALFHDTGFSEGPQNHEQKSASVAREFLQSIGYPTSAIQKVTDTIMATMKEAHPQNKLEEIIRDADLSGLASQYYQIESNRLREEWENISNHKMTDEDWNNMNYQFIKNHEYHTHVGKSLYDEGKAINLKLIKKRIKDLERKNLTISESKSAQTQFKTALRNHIDLSSIADNKANIMLSVNALIITVAMPIIANQVMSNPKLIVPAALLLGVSVTSMIYATLATRPIKMKGRVTIDEVNTGKSNLFFFGNFFKMDFQEYQEGIKSIVSNSDLLDDSITRDLFFLGKSLGAKYTNLRMCYNIFMYGMLIVVVAFCVAMFIR